MKYLIIIFMKRTCFCRYIPLYTLYAPQLLLKTQIPFQFQSLVRYLTVKLIAFLLKTPRNLLIKVLLAARFFLSLSPDNDIDYFSTEF